MPDIVVAAQNRTETGKNVNRRLRAAGAHPRRALRRPRRTRCRSRSRPRRSAPSCAARPGENTLFDLDLDGSAPQGHPQGVPGRAHQGPAAPRRLLRGRAGQAAEVNVHVELVGMPGGREGPGRHPRLRHPRARGRVPARATSRRRSPSTSPSWRSASTSAWPTSRSRTRSRSSPSPTSSIVHVVAPRAEEEVAAAVAAGGGEARGGRGARGHQEGQGGRGGREAAEEPRRPRSARRRPRRRRRSSRRAGSGAPCAWWWGWGTRASATAGRATTLGFMVVDALAARGRRARRRARRPTPGWRRRDVGGEDVLLVKPLTFMNRSGVAVERPARGTRRRRPATWWWSWTTSRSSSGRLRVRERGSHGGHNGLRSLIDVLGTDDFPRVRVGIRQGRASGRPGRLRAVGVPARGRAGRAGDRRAGRRTRWTLPAPAKERTRP